MSRFWQAICAVLGAILGGIAMLPSQHRAEPQPIAEVAKYVLSGALVAVIWAICFRTQVEKLRVSLFSLLVLVAIEAVFLSAVRILNPN